MANKRIKDLANEATSYTLDANQYAVVDGSTGTFKTKLSALSDWIHGRWASFVNALTAKTTFASGDKIAVVNGSTATAMGKDDLLKETAEFAKAPVIASNTEQEKLVISINSTQNGKYLNSSGVVSSDTPWKLLLFDVSTMYEIDVKVPANATQTTPYSGFLASDLSYISGLTRTDNLITKKTYSVPATAKYFAVSIHLTVSSSGVEVYGIETSSVKAILAEHSEDISSLNNGLARIESCFEDSPNPRNVYDNSSPDILNLYISGNSFASSAGTRLVYFKCKKNQKYTISVDASLYHRFSAGVSTQVPVNGGTCTALFSYTSPHTTEGGRDYWTCETLDDSEYLSIYYYNSGQDTATEAQIRATIMVAEGSAITPYYPYTIDTRLKESSLPVSVERILEDDPVSSIQKIYGVEFDNSVESSLCDRIGDAVGKNFNYAVGADMVYDYANDFDKIFPWCEIRRCNVSGGKVVAYEGDADFEVDGTNGDVFVEIPKFYSFRKVVGMKEQICISGTPHSGFDVEPAFIDGAGNELDYIYVAAYATSDNDKSKTDTIPQTHTYFNTFYDNATGKGYGVYDLAVLNAIQKLIVIENADKNVSKYYEGYGNVLYFGDSQANETASGVNTFQIAGSVKVLSLRVGQNVCISASLYSDIRKLTAFTTPVLNTLTGKYECSVTISGDPVDVVAGTTQFYGTMQDNGGCDSMTYHTGRAGENGLSACRYRWMENLWGNVWMQLGGVVVKDLDYYYTYDKTKYKATLDNFEKVTAFKAPEQNHYPGTSYGWITANGFDRTNKNLILPKSIASNASGYYSAKVYTCGTTSPDGVPIPAGTEFAGVCGGGWDHLNRNSPFSIRFWTERSENGGRGNLYGSRLVVREMI